MKAITETNPTKDQVYRAAIKWCGEKERETSVDDVIYFQTNWWVFPGLREYVEREIVNDSQNNPR